MSEAVATICNKALAHVGIRNFVDDLETNQSEEAETCRVFFDDTLASLLADFPWPFASLRDTWNPDPAETREGFLYAYKVPDAVLNIHGVWPLFSFTCGFDPRRTLRADDRIPHKIEKSKADDSKVLLCDLAPVIVFYTTEIGDVAKLPPLFSDALGYALAMKICRTLTGKPPDAQLRHDAEQALDKARVEAFNSEQQDPNPESELIAVRR